MKLVGGVGVGIGYNPRVQTYPAPAGAGLEGEGGIGNIVHCFESIVEKPISVQVRRPGPVGIGPFDGALVPIGIIPVERELELVAIGFDPTSAVHPDPDVDRIASPANGVGAGAAVAELEVVDQHRGFPGLGIGQGVVMPQRLVRRRIEGRGGMMGHMRSPSVDRKAG